MWIAVTKRFDLFEQNIRLTADQATDGQTKQNGVVSCLNAHYYGSSSETEHGLAVGSWGKRTRVRPPRDVDVMYVLPPSVHERFSTNVGNKQSALLQEVKGVLQATYPSTDMRGDGQVVMVRFNTFNVEVVPSFLLTDGRYWIFDTNDGGRYKVADPVAEANQIETADAKYSRNLRVLVRMLKVWQQECNVPLKSFHIELLMTEFIQASPYGSNSYFWYDWLVRDFFRFLQGKVNHYVFVPGTSEAINIGDGWKSRCDSAYDRAAKACEYEHADLVSLAGDEWKKIFGGMIMQDPFS
jgi:hypothetical protein